MARKLDKTASSRPKRKADAPAAGADDLAALHPDAQATLGGRVVVIKEYRFVTGQHVRAKALPFTQALDAQIKRGSALTEDILDVLAQHADLVRELMLDAIVDFDQYKTADEWLEACEDWRGWMKGLNDADGEALLLRWWEVCGLFFLRQVVRRLDQAQKLNDYIAQRQSAGPTSTPASPQPVTATPTTSGAPAPSGN
ncbi:DUF6631 family protein [Rhodanobacter lindaniclasticus]